MRTVLVVLCVAVVGLLPACSRDATPDSLFDVAGYHVRGDTVFYLNAFPGKAFEIAGADPSSFEVFDQTYARDRSNVYLDGTALAGADPATFRLLDRPGFAADAHRVYLRDKPISTDPGHFELLDGPYAGDAQRVYWMGRAIDGAHPASFRVLNVAFECSADAERAYYRQTVIADEHPRSFPPGRPVTGCSDTSISFAE